MFPPDASERGKEEAKNKDEEEEEEDREDGGEPKVEDVAQLVSI